MKQTNFAKKFFTVLAVALLIVGALSVGTLAAFEDDTSHYEVSAESEATANADIAGALAESNEVNFFEKLYDIAVIRFFNFSGTQKHIHYYQHRNYHNGIEDYYFYAVFHIPPD